MGSPRYYCAVRTGSGKDRRIFEGPDGLPRWEKREGCRGTFSKINRDRARRWANRRGYSFTSKLADPYPWVTGDRDCEKELLRALNKVGRDLGATIIIRSGRRTLAEQTALYNQNMISPGVPKPGRPLTAVPNANAPHIRGVAADCGVGRNNTNIGLYPGAVAAMKRHGVCLPVASESWHVERGGPSRWRWTP